MFLLVRWFICIMHAVEVGFAMWVHEMLEEKGEELQLSTNMFTRSFLAGVVLGWM